MSSTFTIALFAILCVCAFAGENTFRCDYKYYKAAEGWLKLHKIPANWKDARLRCQLEGAVLASPSTLLMKYAMTTLPKEEGITCPIHTGVHAIFSGGDFATIEGVPLSKIPHIWAKDEPDNFKNEENCLVLLSDGTIGDVNCQSTFPYICYKKKASLVLNGCGTTDPEYQHDPRTGSCYKFHTTPRTWSRAYMACMAEGGYLAIINSDTEATVIKELYAKHPAESLLGAFWKDAAFIGFHDWNEHGEWRTVHGQSLQQAGYYKFAKGQPDNATTGEFCGSVFRDGLLNDIWCQNSYAFICEKDPASLTCHDLNTHSDNNGQNLPPAEL